MNEHDNNLAAYTVAMLENLLHHVSEANGFNQSIEYNDDDFYLKLINGGDKAKIERVIELTIENIQHLQSIVFSTGSIETRIEPNDDYLLIIKFK